MSLCDILVGDARAMLRGLPDASVQCCVTSPPYFGLRDYGAEGQIGLEVTPEAFVAALVEVFREVRRVLRPDGTLWLNIGDSYAGSWGAQSKRVTPEQEGWRNSIENHPKMARTGSLLRAGGAKPKDLLMIPAQVALALRADGWWLRKDIIWAKPNPMPESVEDRPTSAHEHVFLLAKSEAYFFDAQAIAEVATGLEDADGFRGGAYCHDEAFENGGGGGKRKRSGNVRRVLGDGRARPGSHLGASIPLEGNSRNARDVWTIATQPCGDQLCQRCGRYYPGREVQALPKAKPPHRPLPVCRCGAADGWLAHYATMPPALAERCIRAGTSELGGCGACGAPWRRVVGKGAADPEWQRRCGGAEGGGYGGTSIKPDAEGVQNPSDLKRRILQSLGAKRTTGWQPTCSCGSAPLPQRVLDPFGGAGTTALVARRLQRAVTLVELHAGYARLAGERVRASAPLLEAAS